MRFGLGLAGLTAALGVVLAPVAHADTTRTQSGPGASSDDVFVTYASCADFFGPTSAPRTRINLGPAASPLGKRSLGLVPTAAGTASGPFARFSSLAAVDAGVSAFAGAGTTGVSYIWTIAPDVLPGTAWHGRAEVTLAPGAWQHVAAQSLRYTWSLVDLGTQQPVAQGGQSTPGEFAAAHGNGAGYVVTGFGCDGQEVNIDAAHSDGTTVDFEGFPLTTSIDSPDPQAGPDGTVTVTGTARNPAGSLTGDPLVLETRTGQGQWTPVGGPVLADTDGVSRVTIPVTEETDARWHRPQSQYADEGWSDVITLRAAPATEESAPQ